MKNNEIKNFDAVKFFDRLKNNQCMRMTNLYTAFIRDWKILSTCSKYYLYIPMLLIGTRDFRSRIGTFTDPWKSSVSPLYAAKPLTFIQDDLTDIANNRAIELIHAAKNTSRKIAIMWSGGIDSTFLLCAILKNIEYSDQELLTVYLSTHSIADNPNFYFKFLSSNKKISIKSSANLKIDNDFLNHNLILHGDPGDGIFGPSSSMYKFFSDNQLHLEPWKKHIHKMTQLIEPTIEKDMFIEPGIAKWFVNIINRTLEESGYIDHVSSIADWYWWTYFNFKWSGLCSYPLHNSIVGKTQNGISKENNEFYANNIFYNTISFQNWSYSNLKQLVGKDIQKSHKLQAREYIYEFDKNFQYFQKKRKTSTPPPNYKLSKSELIGHDENWKPIYIETYPCYYTASLRYILQKYKSS